MPWSTGKQEEETPEKKPVWPKVPTELKYNRVHLCDDNPWCAYVMIHNNTVAATSLTSADVFHFPFKHQTNEQIFGTDFSSDNLLQFKQEIELILENNKEVVAKKSLDSYLSDLESNLQGMTAEQCVREIKSHVGSSVLVVDKEIQKNTWFISAIKDVLESKGFIIPQILRSQYSIFGKSLPDFFF